MRIAILLMVVMPTASYAQGVPTPAPTETAAAVAGTSAATAIKVSNVPEEYKIARKLKLRVQYQSLVVQGKSYDVLNCIDGSGNSRELWFDISSFYPGF